MNYELINSEEPYVGEKIYKCSHTYKAIRSENGSCHRYVGKKRTEPCAYYGKMNTCMRCNCNGKLRADKTDIIMVEVDK